MAKNDEVAHSFQPLMGAHGGQVADPVIEARPFIEKAEIMLAKNKELHELSENFLALLKSEFGMEKPGAKLEQWYALDFAGFVTELVKHKITLSLAQKAEWMEHFEKQKTTATALKTLIDTTDRDIDQMVYALYDLTPEEIAIVKGDAQHVKSE